MFSFYRVFIYFSRFQKKEFRDERKDSFLRKAVGTESFGI
jgi:hypothetical protein